jgi:DNA-binding NtrC family response regulator
VVHGIVKSLKGEITVKSKPDKGSCFIIHLPLADTPDRSEASLGNKNKIPRGTEKILFVDDEHNITNIQKQLLSRLGYTVNAFTDPELALEDFLNRPGYYDLIITDMSMPRLPGDMFIRHIRNSAPRLPVIMCSGHSDKLNNPALIDLGIKRVLIKPIKISELARAVRDALDTNIIDLKFT